MTAPRLVDTTIRHQRLGPVRHGFRQRSYSWLVDLDALPDHGALARFEARDHLGSPDRSIRENLDAFLADNGVHLGSGRVLMLANARVLGHVFNPITVFWCYAPDERPACVVVEVHNTYGDRHAYLVHPDAHGHARVEKRLYVSPFNDTSGWYELRVPGPGDTVHVAVTLHREGHPPFRASLHGRTRPASRRAVVRLALTRPWEPLLVTLRIRVHGLWLWLRGLKIQDRPTNVSKETAR
ncbi:MAG TPA: DUF1365 domain-containing protein [Nocardioidaceae bacterium]|nr:DUF1365 domain-containing protein [Nocardioidaceae bacterium]